MSKRFAWLALPAAFFISTYASAATKSFTAAQASLPADTEIVATSNLKSVRSSQTFQKLFPQLLKLDKEAPDMLAKVKKSCGFDPVTAIDDVTLGVAKDEEGAFFVAVNGVTEQKLVDCATKLAKSEGKETITAKKTGNITELKSDKGGSPIFFAWLPDNVLVIASEPEEKATLEKMLGGKGALAKSKVGARLGKIRDDAAVSVVFSKELPVDSMTVKGGDFTLAVKSGVVDIVTTLEMASNKEAEQLVTAAKAIGSLLPLPKDAPKEVEKILKSVDGKASGAEATITASAAEKDLIAVVNWATGLTKTKAAAR